MNLSTNPKTIDSFLIGEVESALGVKFESVPAEILAVATSGQFKGRGLRGNPKTITIVKTEGPVTDVLLYYGDTRGFGYIYQVDIKNRTGRYLKRFTGEF